MFPQLVLFEARRRLDSLRYIFRGGMPDCSFPPREFIQSSEADSRRQGRMARLDLRAGHRTKIGVGVDPSIEVQVQRRIGVTGVEVIERIEGLELDLQHPAFTLAK